MNPSPRELGTCLDSLASFVVDEWTSESPVAVSEFSDLLFLDTLGALVGGTLYEPVQRLREVLPDGDGNAGAEGTYSADSADSTDSNGTELPFGRLFRWGLASTWLDTDSGGSFHPQGHRLPPVPTAHPAPHVLPVLLHHAALGRPTQDLLAAFRMAVEIGMRFGVATTLRPGLHPHGIHGTVAAAVAHGVLLGLSPEQLGSAIRTALCLPVAARLWQPMQGGTVRNAWTALGSYYGARSADSVARRTSTTTNDPNDEAVVAAFSSVFTPGVDLDLLGGRLGDRWLLTESYLKPYACARWIHPALDAAHAVRRSRVLATGRPFKLTEVAAVEIDTFAFAASLQSTGAITTDLHARFDLPICVATLLLDGELLAPAFLPQNLDREAVTSAREMVTVRELPSYTAALPAERPTTVTIRFTDGTSIDHTVRNARGNPSDPLSREEVVAKFVANADRVLSVTVLQDCLTLVADGVRKAEPTPEVLGRVAAELG